jgi:hypothetical protein
MTRTATKGRAHATTALAGVAIATALLSGCTSGSHHAASAAPAQPNAAAKAAIASAQDIANDPTARKAVTMGSCRATSSGWTGAGTVANPGTKSATYTIVVSFTDKASTVLARGTTKVTLKGGATKDWTASANFAKTKDVVCVLRGVATS